MKKFRKSISMMMTLSLGLLMTGCSTSTQVVAGKDGTDGVDGKDGIDGKDGTKIYTGEGNPTSDIGVVGDIYLDSQSGDLYSKGESGWIKTGNIKGATGEAGSNGTDGISIVGVTKTSTSGNVDIYTITYSNGTTSSFTVTNGSDGQPGAQGEKGEDGHTPIITIGSNGNWFVDGQDTGYTAKGPTGDKGEKGDKGETGATGVSILKVERTNGDGTQGTYDTYTIYYSDGSTSTFKIYNAKNGADGHTPTITIGSNGNWFVDGTDTGVAVQGEKGDKGETGAQGEKGDKGETGVSVKNAYVDDNGDLICEMSDGSTINAGKVKDTTKHTVNFYVDDDLVQTVSVKNGDKVSAPSSNVTAGYTINYWNSKDDGGYKWLFSAYTVTSDLDLYADFSYNDYTISFVDTKFGKTIDPITVTYDKSFSFPSVSQVGYTFVEWQDEDGIAFSEGVYRYAGNIRLYSKWSANQYTITIDPKGGEFDGIVSTKTISVTYDLIYELPEPTRKNCVFIGWYDSNDKKVSSKATWKGTENVTYTAKWSTDTNTYNFDAGNGTCDVDTMVIEANSSYELPTPTAPDGYYFWGWYIKDLFIPKNGDNWTYSSIGVTLVANYIDKVKQQSLGIIPYWLSGDMLTYGLYPQARVSDPVLRLILNTLTTGEPDGWYLYNNAYYAKLTAKPYDSSYTFNDGTTIVSGTTYWFECKPITWKILESNNGEYKLLSSVLLDAHCYYSSLSIRTIDGKTICANNYKYSDIRSWLNNEFYNTAFSLDNSYIQTTEVDNSASTTYSSSNSYACENTNDKVYLLSYQDYLNADYGFSTSTSSSTTRECKTTDYARANGAYCDTSSSYKNNGWYSTRSPSLENSVRHVYSSGGVFDNFRVNYTSACVRPSLTIKIA